MRPTWMRCATLSLGALAVVARSAYAEVANAEVTDGEVTQAGVAQADAESRPPVTPYAFVLDLAAGGGSGWHEGGVLAEVVPRLRIGSMEVGVAVSWSGAILGTSSDTYYGAVFGGRHRFARRGRVSFLAEGGVHEITVVPPGLFAIGKARVTNPYLGGRIGVDAHVGDRTQFVVGVWGILRYDASSPHVTGTVTSGGLFGGSSTSVYDYGTVGGLAAFIALRLGFEQGFGD